MFSLCICYGPVALINKEFVIVIVIGSRIYIVKLGCVMVFLNLHENKKKCQVAHLEITIITADFVSCVV